MNLLQELKNFPITDEAQGEQIKSFIKILEVFGDDLYYRKNLPAHICTTVWVTNPQRTKTLMAYHNIYQTFTWFGGHADGEKDLLANAKKELTEESGISNFKVLNNEKPVDFFVSIIGEHTRDDKIVPPHLHCDTVYIFEVSEDEKFQIAIEENSAIEWFNNEEVLLVIDESEAVKKTYIRILGLIKTLE